MQTVKNMLRLVALMTSALALQACSNTYSAKAIEAWVVDSETKKPLEGVIVVAHWELRYGLEGGGSYQLHVMESVTDKSGKFSFPAWGPKKIPEKLPREARLKEKDPGLGLYYPGYRAVVLWTERPIASMSGHGESERGSIWNGKTIEMTASKGGLREYAFSIKGLETQLHFVDSGRGCNWVHVPRMIAALIREGSRFRNSNASDLPSNFWTIDDFSRDYQCGSSAQLLKDYLK